MEDVLEVYARAPDEKRPLVCLDEFSKQLLSHVSDPIEMAPGQPRREDYEYVREGTVSGFMMATPLEGTREYYAADGSPPTAIDYSHARC